ncbi:uncharacterized protein TNCV_220761 [Trichonephila clavipes]|nr:uncharacterized protein TNCV_220761 [Trichonephila clavipes]
MLAKNFKKYFLDEDNLVASYEWIRDLFQDTPEGLSTSEKEIFIDFTSSLGLLIEEDDDFVDRFELVSTSPWSSNPVLSKSVAVGDILVDISVSVCVLLSIKWRVDCVLLSVMLMQRVLHWYKELSECCPTQLLLLKIIRDPAAKTPRFVEWAQNEIVVVPDFHKRILFSDEAHFWWNGYVNKQNCRIWSEANPQVYVQTPLHPEKLTVWCALWAGGIHLLKP